MEPPGKLNSVLDALSEALDPACAIQVSTDVDDLADSSAPRRAMNSTAYRIFKLLQWLITSPLSVDALNQKFCDDPRIGKPVSSDSIWLYINTLKALGCRIRRPSPRNSFQYEMLSHPFGLMLNDVHLDALAQAKAFAQQKFNHQEMRVLDGLLKKMATYSDCEDPKQRIESMFSQSRSFDYENFDKHLATLETWISQGQLLELTYLSPVKGKEQFFFLPVSIFYEQGVLYVRGERPEFQGPSSLRVDRILMLEMIENPVLLAELKMRGEQRTEVVLHILTDRRECFEGLKLGENQGVYEERIHWVETGSYFKLVLQVRDFFYLKQRLLACGLPFRILSPSALKDNVAQTLKAMLHFYQPNGEESHGADECRS